MRQIDEQFIRNIHEVRAIVEPYLLRWFVRHHSPEQLAMLEAVQRDYDRAADEGVFAHWTAQNRRFHSICYDGHYNTEALVMAARHDGLIRAIALRIPASPARARQASREHWAIIEKVREHDEDGAAAIVAQHVRHAGQHMIERMLAVGWSELRRPRHDRRGAARRRAGGCRIHGEPGAGAGRRLRHRFPPGREAGAGRQ